jgi:HEAT repeat protein/energy-coupling factor transporter ATP-binding protein EcfA2
MLEFLTLAGLSAGAQWLVKEVLGPLTKGAAEDFYKDFLKQAVSDGLAQNAPGPVKRAIAQSLKEFLDLFQAELETCGLPKELTQHEFANPLKQLLADTEVRQALGRAFETDVKAIDEALLQSKWEGLCSSSSLTDFDWEQLAKNYLRRVKRIVREDVELSRQLALDYQEKMSAAAAELVGVPVAFDLKKYREALREKFGSLSLDALDTTASAYDNLRLWKVFVAQDVRECAEFAPQLYELPKERLMALQAAGEIDPLLSMDMLEHRRRVYAERPIESVRGVVGLGKSPAAERAVILGDPGSGKSTLLRYMALSWAEQSQLAGVPILIELRLYAQDKAAGSCNSFLEYLHKGNTVCHLNQRELDALLKSGKAVALFDGVDEVFDPQLREAVVTDIHRFSNDYPQVQMVVTSRWLGYRAEALRNAEFKHYMLQDLSAEQGDDFLGRWHETTFTKAQAEEKDRKQARLQRAIAESKPIRELAGNPLLLTMMAILNRNQELPRDRARLYERASEVLLYQWDVEQKLHERAELKDWRIDLRDKQAMLRKVAHHMQANERGLSGNVIGREDLEQILTDYLKTREVERARAVARVMIEQLRERNFILCYLGADNYAFVHRTFLEYFCASEFVHRFEKEKTLDIEGLKELYGENFQDEAWGEVLRLMAGMVEARFVGAIIEHLLAQPVDRWAFARFRDSRTSQYVVISRIVYLTSAGLSNLLLAADCLAEVKTRSVVTHSADSLLAILIKTVENHYPYKFEDDAAKALIGAIANNWSDKPDTLAWLKSCLSLRDSSILAAAVEAIAQCWKDEPNTLPWLKSRALQDENSAARSAAIKVIAQGWRDDPGTLLWLKSRALQDENEYVRSVAVEALVQGWKDDPDTLPWLKSRIQQDENWTVRIAAVRALAQGRKDEPDTLPWLKSRALQDENWDICYAAVAAIAQGWKDEPDTLPWLKSRALQDETGDVRRAAVEAIAQGWKDEPNTLPWLKLRAQHDENGYVRSTAVAAIAQGWKDEPDTLPWLKSRALQDETGDVRRAAVEAIAQGWKDELDTLPLLKFRIQQDEDSDVRRAAVEALVQGWKDDPDTLPWLKSRAQHDENSAVRNTAVRALAQGWKDDPDTLPLIKLHLLHDDDWAVRSAAVEVLAQGWKDEPDTLPLLKLYALQDEVGDVRSAAVKVLARGWKDEPDTLPLLKSLVLQDKDRTVRSTAVSVIAQIWKDEPDTLPMLKSLILQDKDRAVRSTAVSAIAQGWKDEPDTLPMLKSLVLQDKYRDVRRAAMSAIAQGWKDEPDTLLLLKSCAQQEKNEEVRWTAVSAIARGWKQNLELFDFWCDRTIQDPFQRENYWQNNPRQIALKVLVQQYSEHPKTAELLRDRAQNDNDEKLRDWATKQLVRLGQNP